VDRELGEQGTDDFRGGGGRGGEEEGDGTFRNVEHDDSE